MDIVIISQYLSNIECLEDNNSRFLYLANLLRNCDDCEVELITSTFFHRFHRQAEFIDQPEGFKITALHEPGYKKNISLARLYSHFILALNLKKYLEHRKRPDVIYCAVPSLDVAFQAAQYCKKYNIRFIIDIQDLWPEAFKMVFNIPVISNLAFYPMTLIANSVYKEANEIVAVSDSYCKRAMSVNSSCRSSHTVFLGTNLETFDMNSKSTLPDFAIKEDRLKLMYCGSLTPNYNLKIVIDALHHLDNMHEETPFFIIMGDGESRESFEAYAKELNVDCLFTGMLPYNEMCAMLSLADIVVNPISSGAALSIINKHGDYAASGCPVVSTQENLEYRNLIDNYQMGFNCACDDAEDLAAKLNLLIHDHTLRVSMGNNARRCAEERFDRRSSYQEIVDLIINHD